jgi:hypothetical protein
MRFPLAAKILGAKDFVVIEVLELINMKKEDPERECSS